MTRTRTSATACAVLAGLVLVAPTAVSAHPRSPHVTAKRPVSSVDKTRPMSAADRAAIDVAANKAVAGSFDQAPGLWLAVWDPAKGYYEQAYGEAVVGGAKATVSDHFMIGSITKTVFATAVLQQVAKGRLSLSDTVRKLDPALAGKFPKAAKYTVAQLLSMRTQIPDYADAAVALQVADPQHHFTRNDLIALGFEQGKKQPAIGGYSTTNYIILGVILNKLTGKTPEALVNGVFARAGMTQSSCPLRLARCLHLPPTDTSAHCMARSSSPSTRQSPAPPTSRRGPSTGARRAAAPTRRSAISRRGAAPAWETPCCRRRWSPSDWCSLRSTLATTVAASSARVLGSHTRARRSAMRPTSPALPHGLANSTSRLRSADPDSGLHGSCA